MAFQGFSRARVSGRPGRESWGGSSRVERIGSLNATEHGFPYWAAREDILRGWALAIQGQPQKGIVQIEQGRQALTAMGSTLLQPYCFSLLAEASGHAGRVQEGLSVLEDALVLVNEHEEHWWEAELYRLKGELLLHAECGRSQSLPPPTQSRRMRSAELTPEDCFHKALDVARHQQAKSLELRAATSLARLWKQQHKRQDAYDLLAPLYGWFTEGFETADVQEARALLAELA